MAGYLLKTLIENNIKENKKNICKAITTVNYLCVGLRPCNFVNKNFSHEIDSYVKISRGFFNIFNEEAFQEFKNISLYLCWKNSVQCRSLHREKSHSILSVSCCQGFSPFKVFLSCHHSIKPVTNWTSFSPHSNAINQESIKQYIMLLHCFV